MPAVTNAVRELLGDLVVASEELVADDAHLDDSAAGLGRWLHLVIETAAAMRHTRDFPPDLLGALVATFDKRGVLAALCEPKLTAEWSELCLVRSGLEAMRDLVEPLLLDELNTSELDCSMLQRAGAQFERLEPPPGTPPHHWWWFGEEPPNEASMVMNSAMRMLLPVLPTPVSNELRLLVANGFVTIDDCLYLRAPQYPNTDMDRTTREWSQNAFRIEDYLPPDPSRRPVDLAGSARACARHLAFELRRRPFAPCRIVVTVRARTGLLRFHQIRNAPPWTPEYLQAQDDATLVLDTI